MGMAEINKADLAKGWYVRDGGEVAVKFDGLPKILKAFWPLKQNKRRGGENENCLYLLCCCWVVLIGCSQPAGIPWMIPPAAEPAWSITIEGVADGHYLFDLMRKIPKEVRKKKRTA